MNIEYLPIFSRILLEKVGGTYLSLIFLRCAYIPTVQKNRTLAGSSLKRDGFNPVIAQSARSRTFAAPQNGCPE